MKLGFGVVSVVASRQIGETVAHLPPDQALICSVELGVGFLQQDRPELVVMTS